MTPPGEEKRDGKASRPARAVAPDGRLDGRRRGLPGRGVLVVAEVDVGEV
jgi:hypothetical protein